MTGPERSPSALPPPAVLRACDLRKSYGRTTVLRGVDLEVAEGELVAVVGENGSGKSTLMRVLAGEDRADSGSVDVMGTFGFCPQSAVLNDALSVEQHLIYFAAAYGLSSIGTGLRLTRMLGFERYRTSLAGELSGGTRQKLNLTLALMHDPRVLLLDEPYQGFDWETYGLFWELAEALRDKGDAIVIVSHLVFEHERFDRVLNLTQGRIVSERSARHPIGAPGG